MPCTQIGQGVMSVCYERVNNLNKKNETSSTTTNAEELNDGSFLFWQLVFVLKIRNVATICHFSCKRAYIYD